MQQVRRILDNPVYTGRIVFGRTKLQHIEGTECDYKRVKADDYILSDEVVHEAIIDQELFEKAQIKLHDRSIAMAPKVGRAPKYILTGLLRCPMCGSSMRGTIVGSSKGKDGEKKQYRYYQCGHYARSMFGQCKKNAISKERIETEVIEYTKLLVSNPQFAADIEAQIGQQINVSEIDVEISNYQKRLKQLNRSKSNLERDIDAIFDEDDFAERKRQDLNNRLNRLYGEIYEVEKQIANCEQRKATAEYSNITQENIRQMLLSFNEFIDQMDGEDKLMVMQSLISEIHLYPKEQWTKENSPIKEIVYTFPIGSNTVQSFRSNLSNVSPSLEPKSL